MTNRYDVYNPADALSYAPNEDDPLVIGDRVVVLGRSAQAPARLAVMFKDLGPWVRVVPPNSPLTEDVSVSYGWVVSRERILKLRPGGARRE